MSSFQVSSTTFRELGRVDASFLRIYEEHKHVVAELMARLNRPQLVELARKLPYNKDAARVCFLCGQGLRAATEKRLARKLSKKTHSTATLAVYCAAAAHDAAGKVLQQERELLRRRDVLLQDFEGLITMARENKCHVLVAYMRQGERSDDG